MANITIRDLPNSTKEALRVQAAQAGVSLEAYARRLLHAASLADQYSQPSVMELADQYFGESGGADLDLPPRHSKRQPVDFDS